MNLLILKHLDITRTIAAYTKRNAIFTITYNALPSVAAHVKFLKPIYTYFLPLVPDIELSKHTTHKKGLVLFLKNPTKVRTKSQDEIVPTKELRLL
mgnify:CR=1 FL=1